MLSGMKYALPLLSLLAPLCLSLACAAPGAAEHTFSGSAIGEPIVASEVVPLATVHDDPEPYFDRVVLVEGTAKAVCQKVGCWMQLEDRERVALVRWESGCGGKYAFPKDAAGRRVLIQGTFYPKQLSEGEARHMEGESDRPIVIERDGYELNASAFVLLEPE
jgi:hypothetical protein